MTDDPREPFNASMALPSLIALVAANVLPLIGVLFLGWNLGIVLLLYWAESAVLLASNLVKVLMTGWTGIPVALFFLFHAGIFMLVHLAFLLIFFDPLKGRPVAALLGDLAVPLLGLVLSHAISFWHNVVRRGERPKDPAKIMVGFYARIFLMQFTIIFGGMLTLVLGSPTWALALLVSMKTAADMVAHLRERRKHAPVEGPPPSGPSPSLS